MFPPVPSLRQYQFSYLYFFKMFYFKLFFISLKTLLNIEQVKHFLICI